MESQSNEIPAIVKTDEKGYQRFVEPACILDVESTGLSSQDLQDKRNENIDGLLIYSTCGYLGNRRSTSVCDSKSIKIKKRRHFS